MDLLEFEPLRLELKNYGRFGHAVLDFSQITMASIVGVNGAGKSTLMESVLWVLFGETPRSGIRSMDNIVKTGTTRAEALLDFRLGEAVYRIERTRDSEKGRHSVSLFRKEEFDDDFHAVSGENITETQKMIQSLLRMDYQTFVSTAIIPQGGSDLLTADMTDMERKEILGRVLGLGVWDEALANIRQQAREINTEMTLLSQSLENAREEAAKLDGLAQEIEGVEAFLNRLLAANKLSKDLQEQQMLCSYLETEEARISEEIDRIQQSIESYSSLIEEGENIIVADAELKVIEDQIAKLAVEQEELSKKLRLSQEDLRQAEQEKSSLQSQIAMKSKELERSLHLASLLGEVPCQGMDLQGSCHLLKDAVSASSRTALLKEELESLESLLETAEKKVLHLSQQAAELEKADGGEEMKVLQAKADALRPLAGKILLLEKAEEQTALNSAALMPLLTKRAQTTQKLVLARQALSKVNEDLLALRASQEDMPSPDMLESVIGEQRELLGALRSSLERAKEMAAALGDLEEKEAHLSGMLRRLHILERACNKRTGVPALIVENAVPQIESLANETLSSIAEGRLGIHLRTQAETKSGTTQDVLQVIVMDAGQERPYATYSGAERFMVDLSLRVGLSKFLSHRAGSAIRMLVVDEGIAAADAANRQHIIDALLSLERHFSKVIVISHLAELHDAFPQRIEVLRKQHGSAIRLFAGSEAPELVPA